MHRLPSSREMVPTIERSWGAMPQETSSKPVLLVTRLLPPAVQARASRDYNARLNPEDTPRTSADVVALAEGADAVLCCPADTLDAATIAALPATVRAIGTFSVGFDHIDVAAARARGITVVNTPDVLSLATAECALLLLLAAARRAGEGERLVRLRPLDRLGPHPTARHRASSAARSASSAWAASAPNSPASPRGLGMTVHYRALERLPPEQERGAIFHEQDDSFLAASELLSLNAPGGPRHPALAERRTYRQAPPRRRGRQHRPRHPGPRRSPYRGPAQRPPGRRRPRRLRRRARPQPNLPHPGKRRPPATPRQPPPPPPETPWAPWS